MEKVDSYGMKSGIIKVVPPQEWKDALPQLDDLVKRIRVREPIKQDIMGSNGTYRQVNLLHGRSYTLPQWRQLCEQSEHQPPARRGERRANADKPKPARTRTAAPKSTNPSTPKKRGRGRPAKGKSGQLSQAPEERPMTPVSPKIEPQDKEAVAKSVEKDPGVDVDDFDDDPAPRVGRMGGMRQSKPKTQSTSARRKYSRREGSAMIDEAAFKDFDYRMDISDYTPERCEELERAYWKTLTYAPPLYGADMMGTLFDDSTETWSLNKLPNLLDVLGTQVPGVNTAYLYLGMWKATFAWHLEDVDLYSINYLHFGAPKQWYSISQGDARRFEAAMRNIWPQDAKACNQFLRHKSFLISPQHLLQHYGVKVNKVLSYPGEFVVTYPYGYHSGYNLGYNCAEAVNFALDSWLDMGKIAKRCECAQAQDSVWIDVHAIERKLRGEDTEYEETEDDDEDEEDDDELMSGLPTPPASHGVKFKHAGRKRKRGSSGKDGKTKVKKIKLRLKSKAATPCCLCPNDIAGLELLPCKDGQKAHRLCALYLPETFIDIVEGKEVVSNVSQIHKDRRNLKCLFCRSKRGACFQCSQKKCARAYHASCAAAAGVFVEEADVPVYGEDGTEYKEQAFEFSCRFHRTRRDKKWVGDVLEDNARIRAAAELLKAGEICQLQYYKGDIFAGIIIENRPDERTLLVDVLPNGYVCAPISRGLRLICASDRIEVEWKWLLLADSSDYHLPKASANAIPMPVSQKAKSKLNAKRQDEDKPRKDDEFVEGFTWAEFHTNSVIDGVNAKVDFSQENKIWHYLGKGSTDAKAQFTEDPSMPRHNPKGNFLDTIPKPPKPPKPPKAPRTKAHASLPTSYGVPGTYSYGSFSTNAQTMGQSTPTTGVARPAKPYSYKPRPSAAAYYTSQSFMPVTASPSSSSASSYGDMLYANDVSYQTNLYSTQKFDASAFQRQPGSPITILTPGSAGGQLSTGQAPIVHQNASQGQTAPTWYQQDHSAAPAQQPAPSASRAHSNLSWQTYPSTYQKYPFFQVHHNRDSAKYKTPYSLWQGFTNGYQGDLRAYLISNQIELLRHSSLSSGPGSQNGQPQYSTLGVPGQPSSSLVAQTAFKNGTSSPQGYASPGHHVLSGSMSHMGELSQRAFNGVPGQPSPSQGPLQGNKAKSLSASKSYKIGLPAALGLSLKATKSATQIPVKESPVPLPANFLAAMSASPSTPTNQDRTSEMQASISEESVPNQQPSAPAVQVLEDLRSSPEALNDSISKQTAASRVSITPVPLPKFAGLASTQPAETGDFNIEVPVVENSKENMCNTSNGALAPEFSLGEATSSDEVEQAPRPAIAAVEPHQSETGELELSNKIPIQHQEFADVPGSESMDFVERMMHNLKRASLGGQVTESTERQL